MEKTLKVAGLAGLGLAAGAVGLVLRGRADRRNIERLWNRLLTASEDDLQRFDEQMTAGLPAPAQRYFRHALAPGTPLAHAVTLEMEGVIRLKPDGPWMEMNARQVLAPPRGFVWEVTIQQGLLHFSGADYYAHDDGGQRFYLWGVVPFVQGSGPDVTRSARERLAVESILNPASLLPQRGVVWEALGDRTARATLPIDGEEIPLTLTVGDDGDLQSVVMDRWGDPKGDGHFERRPFGAGIIEEQVFGGYTIPTRLHAGWWFGMASYFDFFRPVIRRARFHGGK